MHSAQAHNILLTGASGYLGGSLFAGLKIARLSGYGKIYALVRSDAQKEAVQQYGAEPLSVSLKDDKAVRDVVMQNNISVVFYLIDVFESTAQENLIKALGDLSQTTGQDVHFLHTSGAKIFSSDAGAPTDRELLDTDPNLYDIQKGQKAPVDILQKCVDTNNTIIEEAQARGVRSYIFAPCIVYGKGAGFGNTISIQTTDIVKAAIASGRVHSVTPDKPTWPVCHISDNTALYLHILQSILNGEDIGYSKNGYYLAASGSVAWDDIYAAMARALKARGIIEHETVAPADNSTWAKMAQGLNTDPSLVEMRVGGRCMLTAEHGGQIGRSPRFSPTHILEAADDEVEHILRYLDHRTGSF
ncbi:nad dependent epimerase dehydratase family protein [Colletotrichum kahawae]|uniref:Nad dependent epimerase dehydratase family protein n=1 Tax=Colletotrichum kahawae TaxID=34407 RepID=A0AAD9YW88_COLKA|nr:nad dependent epimerase dehydratase family protein [Colletotrichum kahawae]